MIKTIRYNTRFVYWVFIIVVVAFIGLIFLQWGMDITGINRPGGRKSMGREGAIAVLNGENLSATDFYEDRRKTFERVREQTGGEIDDATTEMIEQQVWDSFIKRSLISQVLRKNGISVSDELLSYVMYNDPPQDFKNLFTHDGVFDIDSYREWLNQNVNNAALNRDWLELEQSMKSFTLPVDELMAIIDASVQVPEYDVRRRFDSVNKKVDIKMVTFDQHDGDGKIAEPSEDEIKAYYDAHKDDFMQKEKADVKFVNIPNDIPHEDSLAIREKVFSLYDRIKNGEDFSTLARQYSDDSKTKTNGGNLGWFSRGQLVEPFEEAAFSAKVGEVTKPVLTRFGWHIIEVLDKKNDEEKGEMVNARHILIEVKPSDTTIGRMYDKADTFLEDVNAAKKKDPLAWKNEDFDEIAKKHGLETTESGYFFYSEGPRAILQKIGFFPEAVKWVFSSDPGDISEVLEHPESGLYIFQVLDRQPAAPKPFEDVKNIIKAKIERKRKLAVADSLAGIFDEIVAGGKDLEEAASGTGKEVKDFEVTEESYLPMVGKNPYFVGRVFSMKKGETSRAIKLSDRYITVFVKVMDIHEPDDSVFEAQRDSIRNTLLTEQRHSIFSRWLEYTRAVSTMEDLREPADSTGIDAG